MARLTSLFGFNLAIMYEYLSDFDDTSLTPAPAAIKENTVLTLIREYGELGFSLALAGVALAVMTTAAGSLVFAGVFG